MTLKIFNKNLFEGNEEAIILTVDGASRGMEGNIARTFARLNADVWEDLESEIGYPIPLGLARVYEIHPDFECNQKYFFIASTLNHLGVLADSEKLKIQASAFRHVLSIAEARGIKSICTGVMVGGWRLDLELAFDQMVKTYLNAASNSGAVPNVHIYVLGGNQYEKLMYFIRASYSNSVFDRGVVTIAQ